MNDTTKTLKELRKKLGMTQSTIASYIGITPNTWARWERGEITPSIPSLRKIDQQRWGENSNSPASLRGAARAIIAAVIEHIPITK